ncbi:MAG TPA: hypothetical protein VIW29_11915 [Polyangiaceae bacterium]
MGMIGYRFMRIVPLSFALLLSLAATGCGLFQNLNVEPIATGAHRPSNVAAYIAVTDDDAPLDELVTANFRIYENDQLVSTEQSGLTLLDRSVAAAHHAILLLDMSQATRPEARTLGAKAAAGFVDKLSPLESVSVFAFDGSEDLVPIANVAKGAPTPSMAALETFTPRDASRNLNGAIMAALAKLDQALAPSGKPVKIGTLVVFASGPDLAGRVDGDLVHDKIWEGLHDVIVVGVGEKADSLSSLARRGLLVRAQAESTLAIALEEAAMMARAELEKYYLVSYCSPARAGKRRLRVEVSFTTKEGAEHTGDFEIDFDARGFEAGCNSLAAPPLTLIPKETYSDSESSKSSGSSGSSQPGKNKSAPATPESNQGDDSPVAPPDQSGYAK